MYRKYFWTFYVRKFHPTLITKNVRAGVNLLSRTHEAFMIKGQLHIHQVDHKLQFERSFVIFEYFNQKLWYLQNLE